MKKTKWWIMAVFVLAFSKGGFAADADRSMLLSPKLGLSAFTGIIGLEYQYKHVAFDLGWPLSGGVRYYVRPMHHSWFAGAFGTGFGYDHDETKDGVAYNHFSRIAGGVGGGYRWLWRSRWSLDLGVTVGAGHDRWTNKGVERTDHSLYITPVASFGVALW